VIQTGKSSYLTNQKAHRGFKDSFELVGIRATAFTKCNSPRNVVFFHQIVFTDGMDVGHFDHSTVQVRVKVLILKTVEHANRSQHAKVFWITDFNF
jgi:hypothetical protein